MFFALADGSSGKLSWDLSEGGEAEVGRLNLFTLLLAGRDTVKLECEAPMKEEFGPMPVGVDCG